MTAKAHPAVITIHPEPSAFERLSSTPATTPSPSRIRTRVPMNSPKNGEVILVSPLDVLGNESEYCSTTCQARSARLRNSAEYEGLELEPRLLPRSQHGC